jgi:hypothetical protein
VCLVLQSLERTDVFFLTDLFLIRPPSGAEHQAISPEHIVIGGDSAGGGLSLALLQVIRDTGLPLPAGGLLISPWCDLTHSFQSIHTNTPTVRRFSFKLEARSIYR